MWHHTHTQCGIKWIKDSNDTITSYQNRNVQGRVKESALCMISTRVQIQISYCITNQCLAVSLSPLRRSSIPSTPSARGDCHSLTWHRSSSELPNIKIRELCLFYSNNFNDYFDKPNQSHFSKPDSVFPNHTQNAAGQH